MKNIPLIIWAVFMMSSAFGQQKTTLVDAGKLKALGVYKVVSGSDVIGQAYTVEPGATISETFYPTSVPEGELILSGTYTSPNGKIAGSAYDNGKQVGNPDDSLFHPNAFLCFENGEVDFAASPCDHAIAVYKLVDHNTILTSLVKQRTAKTLEWRFLVKKSWTRTFTRGEPTEMGTDWMVVDFTEALTLEQACSYINNLKRTDQHYGMMCYTSSISACLLDTGSLRAFILDGVSEEGTFQLDSRSNLVVIK